MVNFMGIDLFECFRGNFFPPLAGDLSWLTVISRCLGCKKVCLPKAPPLLTEPFEMLGRGLCAAVWASLQGICIGTNHDSHYRSCS